MNALLTFNLIGLAIFAWVCVVKIVPSCATSRYRNRLWRLRDTLTDDIRRGEFESPEAARKVVSFMELAIEDADDLTALHVLLFFSMSQEEDFAEDPLELGSLSPKDDVALKARLADVEDVFLAQTLWGSVSGWVIAFLLSPIVIVAAVRDSGRPKLLRNAVSQIRNDLLASNQLNGSHEHLYQHVG